MNIFHCFSLLGLTVVLNVACNSRLCRQYWNTLFIAWGYSHTHCLYQCKRLQTSMNITGAMLFAWLNSMILHWFRVKFSFARLSLRLQYVMIYIYIYIYIYVCVCVCVCVFVCVCDMVVSFKIYFPILKTTLWCREMRS